MKIEIKHRYNGYILFSHEAEENSMRITLEMAVKAGANLADANLTDANLARANMDGANLVGANLAGANLAGAYLTDAYLTDANLARANMVGANLAGANLAGAYLTDANLADANLTDANLASANMARAYLADAKIYGETITIQPIQISGLIWKVLITDGYLRIGCQRHTHERWFEFSDALIAKKDSRAAEFWETWKVPLLTMCFNHAEKCRAKEST